MAGEPIRIEFERSGGFAGLTMASTLDTRELPEDQAEQVEQMVQRLDLGEMARLAGAVSEGGADRFQYRLTIVRGEDRAEVSLPETALSEQLKPIVEKMMELAKHG